MTIEEEWLHLVDMKRIQRAVRDNPDITFKERAGLIFQDSRDHPVVTNVENYWQNIIKIFYINNCSHTNINV